MNKVYPILFKLSTKNKVQVWNMEQKDEQYRTISGTKDGKKVTTEWSTATSKNIGKANETTAIQQATLEIESQYKKKLAQGNYKESIDDIDEDNYFEPMLAKKYEDHPVTQKMINDGKVYSSTKLDGCLSGETIVVTNKGKKTLNQVYQSKINFKILSYNHSSEKLEFKNILNKMKNLGEEKQWYLIELEDGTKIKATGNHLFYVPEFDCYRRVDELSIENYLLKD